MQGPLSLLERVDEIEALDAALAALSGGRGSLVVVEGPAGAGKTALLRATAERADERAVRVLTASASELERGFAFGVARQLFEPALQAAGPSARKRMLARAAGPAAAIVASEPGATPPEDFAADHALTWLAANIAEDAPLALLVDDLHWSDARSLRWLNFLARRLRELPAALVATFRPNEPGGPDALLDGLRTAPGAERLSPLPLSRDAIATLVASARPDTSVAVHDAIHRASAGNPLYARELIRSMDGRPPEEIAAMAIPGLARRLLRRVESLHPAAPRLASAMAILTEGRLADAAALGDVASDEAAAIAGQLVDAEVLESDDPFCFVHPVVRRSLADALPATSRNRLHAAAAERLHAAGAPAEAVAAHLVATRPAGSDAAAATIAAAAREAVVRADPESAVRLFQRALDEGAADPPRWTLQVELGRASALARDPEAISRLEAAVTSAEGHPEAQGGATVALAYQLIAAGRSREAREALERGERALVDTGAAGEVPRFELEVYRAVFDGYHAHHAKAFHDRRDELEAASHREGWTALALTALIGALDAFRGENVPRARALLERAYADGALVEQRRAGDWAGAQLLGGLVAIDELDLVLEAAARTGAAGRRDGALLGTLSEVAYRGNVHVKRGELREAEADLRLIFDVTSQAGVLLWVATMIAIFADVIIERPELADVADFACALAAPDEMFLTGGGAQLLEGRARIRLARRDRDGARADLEVLLATGRDIGIGPTAGPHRSLLALALPASEHDRAAGLVDEELELARASGLPRPLGSALRARGLLTGGESGAEDLRRSVGVFAETPFRLHHAKSLFALGGVLRRLGHRPAARAALADALALADECGAERLAGQADDELRTAGGRPRRRARVGVAALTASELRVARLAADGRSNVEIAQDLFVTVKTVETHIGRAYVKLGLAGRGARRELGAALERPAR